MKFLKALFMQTAPVALLLFPLTAALAQNGRPAGGAAPRLQPNPLQIQQALEKAKLKASPKIHNTHLQADPQTAQTLAALEQLRAGAKAAGKQPTGGTNSTGGASPTGGSGGRLASATNMRLAPARIAAPAAAAPPAPSIGSKAAAPVAQLSPAVACSMSNTALVQTINNVKTNISNPNIVFTQDPQYNDYKIRGCHFGTTQGQVRLNGPFRSGVVSTQIALWTDSEIEVKIDPNLKGETDLNSVSLVIIPASGPQIQLQSCKFYAQRQPVQLSRIPQGWVTVAQLVDDQGQQLSPARYSSPFSFNGSQQAKAPDGTPYIAGLMRFNSTRFNPTSQDIWDFSNLAPGFLPTDFSLGTWSFIGCNATNENTYYTDGHWSAQWDPGNPKRLLVNLGEEHCHGSGITGGLYGDADQSDSIYGLTVTVSGPVGVNPIP